MIFSLRQFLALPFLALFLLIGAVLVWLFYESTMRMERQAEQQLATVLDDRVDQYLDAVLSKPVHAVNAAHRLFRQGTFNPPGSDAQAEIQARQLANIIATIPEISALNFGFADGRHLGVNRSLDKGEMYTSVIAFGSRPYRDVFSFNENGAHDQFLFKDRNPFVPDTRSWYQSAVQQAGPVWYPIYRNPGNGTAKADAFIGIGFSIPEYDEQNKLVGAINSDLVLSGISRTLNQLPLADGGVVLVANEQNQIIGISNDTPLFEHQDKSGNLQLIRIDDNESPLLRAAATRVLNNETGFSYFSQKGNAYLEQVHEFKTGTGLILKVVLLLPESRFYPVMNSDLKSVLFFVLVTLLVVIGLVLLLAFRLSKPIVQMTHWAEQLSQGDWALLNADNENGLQDYPVQEIRRLSKSLSTMASNLHDTVSNLEERVAERTAELEQVNSNLFELSNTDGLTGIPNRRKFDEVLNSEWNRATRTGQPLVAAIIDVDWFKKYNDHYGHLAGDDCLRKVASILKSKIRRSSDLVARYGGEEFAIISPGINKVNALEMANIICSAIAQANLPHAMSPFGMITVSVGVALIVPTIDVTPATLIQAADEALYHAKDSGRNQVIGAEIDLAGKEKYAGSEFRFDLN